MLQEYVKNTKITLCIGVGLLANFQGNVRIFKAELINPPPPLFYKVMIVFTILTLTLTPTPIR